MRYELADFEWTAIRPFLPNKPRGMQCRRVVTRYDKFAANYLAFIKLQPFGFGYALMSPRPSLPPGTEPHHCSGNMSW